MLALLNRDDSFICSLKYNKVKRKREINGMNTLEFETNKEVEFGQRLVFKDKQGLWHEYIIIDYIKGHGDDGINYEVYCEDSTSELYGFYIKDLKPRNEKASSILGRILEGTRFEVGRVDDGGNKSFNLYHTNVKTALWTILEKYELEINVRYEVGKEGVTHRYIDLRNKIGRDVGKRFTYKKDLANIKKTTSVKDLVTALYGYGKGEEIVNEDGTPSKKNLDKIGDGDYGRKITFADINNGKEYVTNEKARLEYGLGKERKHIYGKVEFSDCEDKRELLELTKAKLKELSKPKITYELKVEDLSRYEGYEGEGVGLGDVVLVIDKEINTRVQTRVVSIVDNPLEEIEDSEIILGNFIKDLSENYVEYDKLKSAFENNRNVFNNELEKLANGVKSSYIQRVLEKFNKELNETGGWVYAEEGEGLLILNAPKEGNPTQAINLKGGKIAIANHKNPDGSFAYETFGDGDGFTANLIRAGVLRGGKVFFNLEDGTFLIGESRAKYAMYWDGNALHLRNVDIDLENNRTIQNIISEGNSSKYEIEQRKEEIKQAKEAIESAKRQLNSSISTVQEEVEGNRSSQESKNKILDQQILDLKSSVKITDGKISTSVESLSKTIEERYSENKNAITTKDRDIRTYIIKNYSTKAQTYGLISSKVASIKTDITDRNNSLKKYVESNFSTKTQTDGLISSTVESLRSYTKNSDSNLRRYVESNYSTKTQTKDLISSSVSSLNRRMENAESRLSQTSNEISSKVSKNEFGTKVRQSASDIQIAWNNISNYIQFEHGSIGIYDGSVTSSKKRSMFDENGIHFYRDGYYIGKIGTNELKNDSSKKGLEFDLEYKGAYMTWAAEESEYSDTYAMRWTYANKYFNGYSSNTLHAGCDIDMHGHTLRNVSFEGGGISGTLKFIQVTQIYSDGGISEWGNCYMRFKNGILVESSWSE